MELFHTSQYTFTIYSTLPFIVSVSCLILSLISVLHDNFSKISVVLSIISISIASWLLCYTGILSANNQELATFWAKMEHIGVVWLPGLAYLVTLISRKYFLRHLLILAAINMLALGFLFAIFKTDFLINGVWKFGWGYYPKYGPLGIALVLTFAVSFLLCFHNYNQGEREAETEENKQRIRALRKLLVLAIIATVDFIPAFGFPLYPFGFTAIFIFLCATVRTMWKYNLFEITPAFASRPILKNLNDILVITDKQGNINLVNPAAEKFFGQPERRLVNKHISEIIDDPIFDKGTDLLSLSDTIKDYEISSRSKNNEDSLRILSISISKLNDRKKNFVGIILTAQDRTDYRNARENIQRLYKTTQTILEEMPVGIMILDQEKRIKNVNKTALQMLGLKENEVIGQICHSKICRDRQGRCPICDGQNQVTMETTLLGPGGKEIPIQKIALKTVINNETVFLEAFSDITESKQLQDQLKNYKEYLEEQVEERTKKLQDANKQLLTEVRTRKEIGDALKEKLSILEEFREATVARENEMIEIKKIINSLSERLKISKPYNLTFLRNKNDLK